MTFSDSTDVTISLPVADGPLPGLQLPIARDLVVFAEVLTKCVAQPSVGTERRQCVFQ